MVDCDVELAATFAAVARSLLTGDDVETVLRGIVETAVDVVDACQHAGIELVEGRTIRPVAPSSATAERLATLQDETGEGPCLSAIWDHAVFQTDDLAHEARWPRFAERAFAETGIRSILGFRLFIETDTMGALNLYSCERAAFDDQDAAVGSVLAAHAAVALSTAQERKRLTVALENRDLIGQAKGMLMGRAGVSDDEAFAALRAASQRLNLKLRVVAEQVVSGAVEIDPVPSPGSPARDI